MADSTPPSSPKSLCSRISPAAIALGAGIGTGMGVALHNLAIGVALGTACALVFNIAFAKKNA
jgi:hypothetical protein